MTELESMLERQARWQKSRQALTWPEKIRMAEQARESISQLRSFKEREKRNTCSRPEGFVNIAGPNGIQTGNKK